jgi:hypothetical protein
MGDPAHQNGLGAIQLSLLDRDDVATWISNLAEGGKLSRRGVQICRNVLRASLREAVDEGLIPRSPAARVGLPRTVAKPDMVKETDAWSGRGRLLLRATAGPSASGSACCTGCVAVRSSRCDGTTSTPGPQRCGSTSLVATRTGAAWSNAKNERSRRIIPLDDETLREFAGAEQHRQRSGWRPARRGRTRI